MGAQTKVSGTWRDMTAPYIKVSGAWNIAKSAWTKLDGQWRSWFLQGGVLDKSLGGEDELRSSSTPFTTNTGTGASANVSALAIQSDGKILVGGDFLTFNGTTVNRIARLSSAGVLETTFDTNTGTGAGSIVRAIAIQSDGKILVGGDFTTFNGTTVNRIARLNSDGTLDTAFTTNIGTATNDSVWAIAIQSDSKIVIVGAFTTFNGTTVNRVVRLRSDGTLDAAFTTNTGTGGSSTATALAIQSDGKIVIVGAFTTFNGTTVNRIARLNADGTLDTTFTTNTGTAANGNVFAVPVQSDGKIVLGGDFTTFNGTTVNRVVRLNSDGTRDTAFTTNTGTGANGNVDSLAVQSDDKIVIGGTFLTFNGTTVNRIVRLNSDGTRDTTFTTNAGTGASAGVGKIAIQSDGKILLGGSFTTFNGTTVNRIARLSSDGILEPSPGPSSDINALAIQSDGKILLGGFFTTFNGTTVNKIVRLNSDGTLDTAFTANIGTGADANVNVIAVQSDGKILLGGVFTTFNGTTVNKIVRLNSDGTLDTAFDTNTGTGASDIVFTIAIQSDGKIVVGGAFTTFDGTTVNRIVRLNSDGTRDTAFTTNTGTGANNIVRAIAVQSDGKIIIGGDFFVYNGGPDYLARLNSDGTRDTSFATGGGVNGAVYAIAVQSDGKILLGGNFTIFSGTTVNRVVRLNSDGTRDTTFTTNTGTGANLSLETIAIQSDGKIVLGGNFSTFNGTTVNFIARLNADGTRDTAFTTNTGTGVSDIVYGVAIQSDGKILVGGRFTTINGIPRFKVARIGGALAQ
jgi:uncharacterized delta-60 repeat protein